MDGRFDDRGSKRTALMQDIIHLPPPKCTKCSELEAQHKKTQKSYFLELEHLRQANQKCLDQLQNYMSPNAFNVFVAGLQLGVSYLTQATDETIAKVEEEAPGAPVVNNDAELKRLRAELAKMEDENNRLEIQIMNLKEELAKVPKAIGTRRSLAPEKKDGPKKMETVVVQTIHSGSISPREIIKEVPGPPQPGGGGGAIVKEKERKAKPQDDDSDESRHGGGGYRPEEKKKPKYGGKSAHDDSDDDRKPRGGGADTSKLQKEIDKLKGQLDLSNSKLSKAQSELEEALDRIKELELLLKEHMGEEHHALKGKKGGPTRPAQDSGGKHRDPMPSGDDTPSKKGGGGPKQPSQVESHHGGGGPPEMGGGRTRGSGSHGTGSKETTGGPRRHLVADNGPHLGGDDRDKSRKGDDKPEIHESRPSQIDVPVGKPNVETRDECVGPGPGYPQDHEMPPHGLVVPKPRPKPEEPISGMRTVSSKSLRKGPSLMMGSSGGAATTQLASKCSCGSKFAPDAKHCRKCGKARADVQPSFSQTMPVGRPQASPVGSPPKGARLQQSNAMASSAGSLPGPAHPMSQSMPAAIAQPAAQGPSGLDRLYAKWPDAAPVQDGSQPELASAASSQTLAPATLQPSELLAMQQAAAMDVSEAQAPAQMGAAPEAGVQQAGALPPAVQPFAAQVGSQQAVPQQMAGIPAPATAAEQQFAAQAQLSQQFYQPNATSPGQQFAPPMQQSPQHTAALMQQSAQQFAPHQSSGHPHPQQQQASMRPPAQSEYAAGFTQQGGSASSTAGAAYHGFSGSVAAQVVANIRSDSSSPRMTGRSNSPHGKQADKTTRTMRYSASTGAVSMGSTWPPGGPQGLVSARSDARELKVDPDSRGCPCGNVYLDDSIYCRKCGAMRRVVQGLQAEPYIAQVWEQHPHGGRSNPELRRELIELGAVSPPGTSGTARQSPSAGPKESK